LSFSPHFPLFFFSSLSVSSNPSRSKKGPLSFYKEFPLPAFSSASFSFFLPTTFNRLGFFPFLTTARYCLPVRYFFSFPFGSTPSFPNGEILFSPPPQSNLPCNVLPVPSIVQVFFFNAPRNSLPPSLFFPPNESKEFHPKNPFCGPQSIFSVDIPPFSRQRRSLPFVCPLFCVHVFSFFFFVPSAQVESFNNASTRFPFSQFRRRGAFCSVTKPLPFLSLFPEPPFFPTITRFQFVTGTALASLLATFFSLFPFYGGFPIPSVPVARLFFDGKWEESQPPPLRCRLPSFLSSQGFFSKIPLKKNVFIFCSF